MKRRPGRFNMKRSIMPETDKDKIDLDALCARVGYGGNPEHKKDPGDFGLTPPASPRVAKSLCDSAGVVEKKVAVELLKDGIKRGMISSQTKNGWPQNIWSVDGNGVPFEAQLENSGTGAYHGYPLPESDPFGTKVLEEWKRRSP